MNRILRRCGIGIIKKKLASLEEELGIEIVYVNPAYTSQECPHCHYIDKKNRKQRSRFECLLCGYTVHADVVGSRNVQNRSSAADPSVSIDTCKQSVLRSKLSQFIGQFEVMQREPGHWLSRLHSKAITLAQSNPYFQMLEIQKLRSIALRGNSTKVESHELKSQVGDERKRICNGTAILACQ